jgi:hypothetical protein
MRNTDRARPSSEGGRGLLRRSGSVGRSIGSRSASVGRSIGSRSASVGRSIGSRSAIVGGSRGVSIARSRGVSVARSRGVSVGGTQGVSIAGLRGVSIAGLRGVSIAGLRGVSLARASRRLDRLLPPSSSPGPLLVIPGLDPGINRGRVGQVRYRGPAWARLGHTWQTTPNRANENQNGDSWDGASFCRRDRRKRLGIKG